MRLRIPVLATLLAASTCVGAQGNGENILNAFISTFAKTNPGWMKNITILRADAPLEPGAQIGYSPVMGDFGFMPKIWDDLTDEQKKQVYADTRLKAYIVSVRNAEIFPSITNAGITHQDIKVEPLPAVLAPIKIDPIEMIRKRPLLITVN